MGAVVSQVSLLECYIAASVLQVHLKTHSKNKIRNSGFGMR
jgi:hypothetical protein